MSLTQATERVFIYRGGVNFAIIVGEARQLILIDSGLDSGPARKALRPFFESGHSLAAIINTHSHADHIGGNGDLVKRTGCQVWAPAKERPFILWPELEPLGLNGGAWPTPGLQVKLLQAQPTPAVLELPKSPGTFHLAGVTMELLSIPGHALDQVAIAVDGLLIAADGLFTPEIIDKHPIIFLVNVAEYLNSLEVIAARPERLILPGHGDLIDRTAEGEDPLPPIIAANWASVGRVHEAIIQELEAPLTSEELLYRVIGRLGKTLDNEPQFFLDRTAIAAHVSYLLATDRLSVTFAEGRRWLAR